jgi:hypothetical protein
MTTYGISLDRDGAATSVEMTTYLTSLDALRILR